MFPIICSALWGRKVSFCLKQWQWGRRRSGPEQPQPRQPTARCSPEQIDRPLEYSQLFFLPLIKTIYLGGSISVSPFFKSQYNATIKSPKPGCLGSSTGSSHLLFKFSASQNGHNNRVYTSQGFIRLKWAIYVSVALLMSNIFQGVFKKEQPK